MKPKDYISKFDLSSGWKKEKQKDFLNTLTSEFIAQLEYCKAENNIKGFDNALKVIRMKWDSISNKIPYGLPDGLWNYFFATVVAPTRDELCPKEMTRRKEKAAERKAEWERRQSWKKEREEMWRQMEEEATRSFYERIAMVYIFLSVCPIESFTYFGLSVKDATTEDVMKKYREKAIVLHPDRGGKQEDFVQLVEHKNRCLKWISQKVNK